MPTREQLEAFVADVMSEDHVGAIERWYAPGASMQENQGEPRVGREVLMEGERRALARVASVRTELLAPPLVEGDHVAVRWRFTFTRPDGSLRIIEEVAWQLWGGDKILRETFFYDPKQMI